MNQTTVQCHILDTGYCLVWEHHLIQGGRRQRIHCHALAALIRHPQQGWLLWDTGYAPQHLLQATRRWPFWLYRRVTPLRLDPALAIARQITRWGLSPNDIDHIVISHFHADHIAGLRDFPCAGLIASHAGYTDIASRREWQALRRGFIPELLPDDFLERTRLIDLDGPALGVLGPTHDLFGDGSLLLVALPGHARGQLGMLVSSDHGRILLAADGSWLRRAIRDRCPPHHITHVFVDDPAAVCDTIDRLHAFTQANPDVVIVPTHCPEAFEQLVERGEEQRTGN